MGVETGIGINVSTGIGGGIGGGSTPVENSNRVVTGVESSGVFTKGQVVFPSAYSGPNGAPIVSLASVDDPTTFPAMGILDASTGAGEFPVNVVSWGLINGLNTSSFALKDELYLGTAGSLVNVRPARYTQAVAQVMRVDAVNGEILAALETGTGITQRIVVSSTPFTVPLQVTQVVMAPGSGTLELALATNDFNDGVLVLNDSVAEISVIPSGAETIDGATNFVIPAAGWGHFFLNDLVDGWKGIGGIATTQDSVNFGDRVFIGVGS